MNPAELYKHAPAACRAAIGRPGTLALRVGGTTITDDRREELLARVRDGQHVEIEVDLLAFEQEAGIPNRNFVRFRDGALMGLGTSGKGTPLIRDHEQDSLLSRAGTIVASKTTKVVDGHYQIHQTAKVTAPWAVDAILRGNLDRFSIGWNPTGSILCSACNQPIRTVCYHYPGDRLAEREDSSGKKYLVRSAEGDIAVEWIFTEADLVETSGVSVPAVPSAQIEGIRAALSALGSGNTGEEPEETQQMKKFPVLVTMLGLGATATEDEVINAVETLKGGAEAKDAKLAFVEAQRDRLATELGQHKVKEAQVAEDELVRDALNSGKIAAGEEVFVRRSFKADPEGTRADIAKIAPGSATPVGQPRQSLGARPPEPSPQASQVNATLSAHGVDPELAFRAARAFGATEPEKTAAKILGIKQGG